MAEIIHIDIVFALPEGQDLITLPLPVGTTLGKAVEISGFLQKYPQIDIATAKFGIYSKLSGPDTVLRDHDRIEIYRPLIADPKAVRKQRATEGRAKKKGATKPSQ